MTERAAGNKILNQLVGKVVESVEILGGSYGLIERFRITTADGLALTVDANGTYEGECGTYPGMNFRTEQK